MKIKDAKIKKATIAFSETNKDLNFEVVFEADEKEFCELFPLANHSTPDIIFALFRFSDKFDIKELIGITLRIAIEDESVSAFGHPTKDIFFCLSDTLDRTLSELKKL